MRTPTKAVIIKATMIKPKLPLWGLMHVILIPQSFRETAKNTAIERYKSAKN